MRFDIITIFPGLFTTIFDHGVVKRAVAGGLVDIRTHDLRDFTHDRHRTVDDRPFGGGEGMVLKPEPLAEALEAIGITDKPARDPNRESVILLSAQGRKFTQSTARELAELERVALICGRYEGVDERVNELFVDRELSIGDYVLSGGELGAAVIVDATMRLLPGVLGNEASSQYESFGSSEAEMAALDSDGTPAPLHPRLRRAPRLSPLHPPSRVPRPHCPRSPQRRRPPKNQPLAPRTRIRKDAQKSPRPAGNGRAKRSRP